ncbi:WXG100-like domain-containing protein [Mycobacterium kiyosense]|uniref:Outer membrane channel protein CpnT-like N-terminal domain-containing protein n=1 Tax=Mycobacterium kiyosense TaxID=2871094 RepID=A0A9P3QB68_9MYCO|nr:hypothetical protein [Mycobacterium kiyosense]GLD33484.1 hypothetical protein Mkiyose1413_53670 [Mycobacterium kiyosense]
MATVSGVEVPDWWAERNNRQIQKLLKIHLQSASNPLSHPGVPSVPHVAGDHPPPQGAFVALLFGPLVWPLDSETQVAALGEQWRENGRMTEEAATEAYRAMQEVFSTHWTAGEGAGRAYDAYSREVSDKFELAEMMSFGGQLIKRSAGDVEYTKRMMLRENTDFHQEIQAFLKSMSGQSIAQIAVILAPHRAGIEEAQAQLRAHVAKDTLLFTNRFPLSPNGGKEPKVREAGNGTGSDTWTDPETPAPGALPPKHPPALQSSGRKADAWSDSPAGTPRPSGPLSPQWSDGPGSRPSPNPLSSLGGGGLPSLPSMPGGGGGVPGFPMSMLQGFGKFPGATGFPSTAGLSSPVSPPPALSSLGADFGRGLAAGASAAGAMPAAAPPSAPLTPLMAAPVESTAAAAAPAAAAVAAPISSAPSGAGVPAMGAGAGLAPYGSVLPPTMSSPAPASVGAGSPAGLAAAAEGAVSTAGGSSAGLMPVGGRRRVSQVVRDSAETDLGRARLAVADLAGAASVIDPGLDWAVAVSRDRTGGISLWVATNDGATYIPPGVFLHKTMPIAAVFNEDFDARWFGWVNPADKAVRAARSLGEEVSAVATSWALPSEYLTGDPVPEMAVGVAPSGVDSLASQLSRDRSHRLKTVDPALYAAVKDADPSVMRTYCRELVRRLVFGDDAEGVSAVVQAVGRALVAGNWPAREEWAALRAEYDKAHLLAGTQRPGLDGFENAAQIVSYVKYFVEARRMEALLCWEQHGGDLANVVYSAWVCGVRLTLKDFVLK